jgi:hypothetical protein
MQFRAAIEHDAYDLLADRAAQASGQPAFLPGLRFELIGPEHGPTFVPIALGWCDGRSCRGLCEPFAELAA